MEKESLEVNGNDSNSVVSRTDYFDEGREFYDDIMEMKPINSSNMVGFMLLFFFVFIIGCIGWAAVTLINVTVSTCVKLKAVCSKNKT